MPARQPLTGDPAIRLEAAGLDAAARQVLNGYLDRLANHLPGPTRTRRAILAEVGDGLTEATHAHLAAQPTPAQAARAAVVEFGEAPDLAAAFAPELAARGARRTALALIATGPLVGSLWLTAFALAGPTAAYTAPPWQWPIVQAAGWPARLLLSGAIVTVLACWLTVALTGRLTRWLPPRPGLPATAATAAATGACLLDLGMLTLLVVGALTASVHLVWAPLLVAAAASLTRLVLTGRAVHHLTVHTVHPSAA